MRPKVVEQAGALERLLAPALFYRRPEADEMRFVMGDMADQTLVDAVAYGTEPVIPAPVVKDAEQASFFLAQGYQAVRLVKRRSERLVDHHVLARPQCGAGKRYVGGDRGRDDHDVDHGMC